MSSPGGKRPNPYGSENLPQAKRPEPSAIPAGVIDAAEIARRKAAAMARLAALGLSRSSASSAPAAPSSTPAVPVQGNSVIQAAIAEAKARAAAALQAKTGGSGIAPPTASVSISTPSAPPVSSNQAPKGYGLDFPPSLQHGGTLSAKEQAQKERDRYKTVAPKFTSLKANARNATGSPGPSSISAAGSSTPKINPYLNTTPDEDLIYTNTKAPRQLKFIQKGKYVQIAEQIKAEEQLEALKQRIAERARLAGLESDFNSQERIIRREPPPEVEWWDEPLLQAGATSYPSTSKVREESLIFAPEDSPVTVYIQHPIELPGPGAKKKVEARPLMLTKKEAKKMRKQRRMAELQDRQDRVRMGLIPPDAPKVRLANLMRVLASDAIQDPTKVEAKVRREVAGRRETHEKTNEARKLTDEQRREKKDEKKEKDEAKGLFAAAFKIKYLTNPSHRFKVVQNARQAGLMGCCLYAPNFALIYVEGSAKSIKFYKRLMTIRIDWTEEARAKDDFGGDGEGMAEDDEEKEKQQQNQPVAPQSLKDNKCELVWEGALREKAFNIFKAKSVESERAAREFLGSKNEGIWDLAARYQGDEI